MTATSSAGRPRQLEPWSRHWTGIVGLLLLAGLWLGPLRQLSHTSFSAHMLLHLGVITVAAPLLAYAISGWLPPIATSRSAWRYGLIVSMADLVVVWGWHAPSLHAAAAREMPVFVLQQVSFLGAGISVWILPFLARSRGVAGISAFALFLIFTHMSMFGLLLTLAPSLLYPQDVCGGGWGLTPLEDQQLGGAMMTVGGGLSYLVGAVSVAYHAFARGREGQASP